MTIAYLDIVHLLSFFDFNSGGRIERCAAAQTIVLGRDQVVVVATPGHLAKFFGRHPAIGPMSLTVALGDGAGPDAFPHSYRTGQASGWRCQLNRISILEAQRFGISGIDFGHIFPGHITGIEIFEIMIPGAVG